MSRRAVRLVVMMVRPPVAVLLLLCAAIGLAAAGRADAFHPLFTTVLVTLAGWFVHATVLNDVDDEAIDRVNLAAARGRPLVSGVATRAELLALGRAAGFVSLLVGWATGWRVGAVVTLGLALNVAYSRPPLRVSRRGGVASCLLPLGYVAVPYLVGVLSVKSSLGRQDLVVLAGLYVVFAGRILLKDFRDVRGDAMHGKRTFLVRHGPIATCRLSAACWMVGTSFGLAIVPVWSPLALAFAVFLAGALEGLRRLARASDPVSQQVAIAAVATAGRAMAVTLLAYLSMANKGWTPTAEAVVTAALVALFTAIWATTVASKDRVAALNPY